MTFTVTELNELLMKTQREMLETVDANYQDNIERLVARITVCDYTMKILNGIVERTLDSRN